MTTTLAEPNTYPQLKPDPKAANKICGLMVVRGDDWSLGLAMRVALLWCNALVVLFDDRNENDIVNNMGVVQAENVADLNPGRVQIIRRVDTKYDEVETRMTVLRAGRAAGYGSFGIIDADEVASPALTSAAKRVVYAKPGESFGAKMIAPWGGIERCRTDGIFENASITFAFKDGPGVGWTNDPDGYGYHRRNPCDRTKEIRLDTPGVSVAHLQYVSLSRLRWKAVWYKAMERLRFPGRMTDAELDRKYDWWFAGMDQPTALTDFASWYPALYKKYLHPDSGIWQRDELIGWIIHESGPNGTKTDEAMRRVLGDINIHALDIKGQISADIDEAHEYGADPFDLARPLPTP